MNEYKIVYVCNGLTTNAYVEADTITDARDAFIASGTAFDTIARIVQVA